VELSQRVKVTVTVAFWSAFCNTHSVRFWFSRVASGRIRLARLPTGFGASGFVTRYDIIADEGSASILLGFTAVDDIKASVTIIYLDRLSMSARHSRAEKNLDWLLGRSKGFGTTYDGYRARICLCTM